jgi:hypothetical protein
VQLVLVMEKSGLVADAGAEEIRAGESCLAVSVSVRADKQLILAPVSKLKPMQACLGTSRTLHAMDRGLGGTWMFPHVIRMHERSHHCSGSDTLGNSSSSRLEFLSFLFSCSASTFSYLSQVHLGTEKCHF